MSPLSVLGIVTARGGSKGIPRKNLAQVLGRPLLAYTADVALATSALARVVLSTEDPEIARVGEHLGLEVPVLRPLELAQDDTPTIPVLQHMVRFLEERGDSYDAILVLQPTNPLRRVEDIEGAISLMERTGAESVISFTEVGDRHPARMKSITDAGWVEDPSFAESFEGQPRQQLPRLYLRDGSIYLTRRDVLMRQNSLKGTRCQAWLVPSERACNVDDEFDLRLVEFLLSGPKVHANPGCRIG